MSVNEMILNKLEEIGVVVKWINKGSKGGFVFNIEFNSDWIDDSGKVNDIKFDVDGREFRLVGGLKGKKYSEEVVNIVKSDDGGYKEVKEEVWKEVVEDYMRIVEGGKIDVLSRMNSLS